jgi:hypothetical protein
MWNSSLIMSFLWLVTNRNLIQSTGVEPLKNIRSYKVILCTVCWTAFIHHHCLEVLLVSSLMHSCGASPFLNHSRTHVNFLDLSGYPRLQQESSWHYFPTCCCVVDILCKAYFNMFIVVWNITKCNSYQLPNIIKLEHPTDVNRVRVEHHGP